jgi:hypothetical protein
VAQIFQQAPASVHGFRQAESNICQFASLRNRERNIHRVTLLRATLIVGGIERWLKGDVVIKTVFLRIVNATCNAQGHKGKQIFYHMQGSLGQIVI